MSNDTDAAQFLGELPSDDEYEFGRIRRLWFDETVRAYALAAVQRALEAREQAPSAAVLLAEQVLHMDMVTERGQRARSLARQVLDEAHDVHEGECADMLRSLASCLGAGGYNAPAVDPAVFREKIMWGINELRAARQQEAPAAQAQPAAFMPRFAGVDPKFCPGSNPDCPQEFPEQRFPTEEKAQPAAVAVTAEQHFKFSAYELADMARNPRVLAALMDYHEARQTEADAFFGGDESAGCSGNRLRKQALYERGRSIMAEDLDIWDNELRAAFGFPPYAHPAAAAPAVPQGWTIETDPALVSIRNTETQCAQDFYPDRDPLIYGFLRALAAIDPARR